MSAAVAAIKRWSAEDVINLCIVVGLQTTALFALCIALWMCMHHITPPTELWIYITGISTGTIGYLSRGAQALAKAMAQNADSNSQPIADSNQGTVIVNPPAAVDNRPPSPPDQSTFPNPGRPTAT